MIEKREVNTFPGYFVTSDGEVIGKRGKVLKGKITWDGYREIVMSDGEDRRSVRVHILVAECFLGKRKEGMQVNHKDGNKLNNKVSNLEYVTASQNIRHAFTTGLAKCKGLPVSSLDKKDFEEIIRLHKNGKTYKEICEVFNLECRQDYIGEILSGRKHSEVSGITQDLRRHVNPYKVSDMQVQEIRTRYKADPKKNSYKVISAEYGISLAQISRIINGTRRQGGAHVV